MTGIIDEKWRQTFDEAMAWDDAFIDGQRISEDRLRDIALEELKAGHININDRGITDAGMVHIVPPVAALWQEWLDKRKRFLAIFPPYQKHLALVSEVEAATASLKEERKEFLHQFDENFYAGETYQDIDQKYKKSRDIFNELKGKYKRMPVLFSEGITYYIVNIILFSLMLFVTFGSFRFIFEGMLSSFVFSFVLSGFLAFSMDSAGEMFKQFSVHFSMKLPLSKRRYNMIWLSGCLVLLILVLGVDWFLGIANISSPDAPDGWQYNPLVMTGGSLAYWFLGFVLSYVGHDADPLFVTVYKKHLYWRHEIDLLQARHRIERKKIGEDYTWKEREHSIRLEKVQREYAGEWKFWEDLENHKKEVRAALTRMLYQMLRDYRDILLKEMLIFNPLPEFFVIGQEIQPYHYEEMSFSLSFVFQQRETEEAVPEVRAT